MGKTPFLLQTRTWLSSFRVRFFVSDKNGLNEMNLGGGGKEELGWGEEYARRGRRLAAGSFKFIQSTIRTPKITGRKNCFGNSLKSCNALHDRKHHSQIFVFHASLFGQK